MKKALIIMTRVPIPGKTKTRLIGYLSKEHCAMLHIASLKDIYNTCRKTTADVIVFYTPVQHGGILRNILEGESSLYPQEGMDLGERMLNAISKCLSMGYDYCVLIGSDIPAISVDMLEKAFVILENKDIAIAPTYDGGYCLIGMKKPFSEVFKDNFYGTAKVYDKTISIINKLNLTSGELEKCLDLDVKKDVEQLIEDINSGKQYDCVNTIEFLKGLKLLSLEENTGEYYGANDN